MYNIVISKKAEKALYKLPKFVIQSLRQKFENLSNNIELLKQIDTITNPKSIGIHTKDILYKIRVSDYRCLFVVQDSIITITIIEIEHHSKVYRKQ